MMPSIRLWKLVISRSPVSGVPAAPMVGIFSSTRSANLVSTSPKTTGTAVPGPKMRPAITGTA